MKKLLYLLLLLPFVANAQVNIGSDGKVHTSSPGANTVTTNVEIQGGYYGTVANVTAMNALSSYLLLPNTSRVTVMTDTTDYIYNGTSWFQISKGLTLAAADGRYIRNQTTTKQAGGLYTGKARFDSLTVNTPFFGSPVRDNYFAFKQSKTRSGRMGMYQTTEFPTGTYTERERWFWGTGGALTFLPGYATQDSHSGGVLMGDRSTAYETMFGYYTNSQVGRIAWVTSVANHLYQFTPAFTHDIITYDTLLNVNIIDPASKFTTYGTAQYNAAKNLTALSFLYKQKADSLYAAIGSGVFSFNSRTGAVIPVAGDYASLTETLINKSISGSTNTLTNISNSALTNNSISGVALGGNLNSLNIGYGLSPNGTNFNGSTAVFLNVDTGSIQTNANFLPKGNANYLKLDGSNANTNVDLETPGFGLLATFGFFQAANSGNYVGYFNNTSSTGKGVTITAGTSTLAALQIGDYTGLTGSTFYGDGHISIKGLINTGSTTLATSLTGILKATSGVVSTIVSGTDVKTINSASLLGSGNILLQTPLVAGTDYLTPSGSGASITGVVHTTGNETIGGFKTFSVFPSSAGGYGMGGSNNSFFGAGFSQVNNTPGSSVITSPTVALGDAANATGMAWVLNASYGLDLHKYSTTPSVIDNIVGSFSNIGDISGFRSLSIAGNGTSLISATNSTATSVELITATNDRTFAGSNNWTGTNWATTGGTFQHTTGSAVAATLTNANLTGSSIVIQRQYMVTFTMSNRTVSSLNVALGGTSVSTTLNGVSAIIITAGANNADLTFTPAATTFDGAITNVSVKQIQPYFSVGGNNSLYVNSNANALYPASYIGNGLNTALLSAQRSPLGQGTLSTTAGANTVTGVGTNWTNDLNVGETIYAGGEAHVIATIGNSTTITTVDNWTNTLTNVGYTIPPTTPFSVNGRGQTLLTSNVGNGAALNIANVANNSSTSGSVQGISNTVSYSNNVASQNVFVNNYVGAITINSANTQNLTNAGQGISNLVFGTTYQSGATGTVTNSSLLWGKNFNNAASGITITNGSLIHFNSFVNAGTITNMVGLNIPAFTGGTITNQTSLLLGQVTAPSGNWGIYENLALNNYLGTGWTGINTTTQIGTDKLDVNGKVSFSDGTQGLILGAYTAGGGNGAIYPYGVTPGSSNYAFSASTSLTELAGTTINLRATTTANILIGGVNYVTVNSSGINFNGSSLLNVATPVSGTDGVNKSYVDTHSLPSGLDGQIVSYYDGGVPLAIGRLSVQNAKTIFIPTTGGTVNVNNNYENIIKPSGALATLIINLPSSPSDGDAVNLTFTQAITAITYTGGTVVGAPTSAAASGQYHLTFDSGSSTWY